MIFKVTHIDLAGHRRRARVTAQSVSDAMDQADRLWGAALAMACLRMSSRPELRLVADKGRRAACV